MIPVQVVGWGMSPEDLTPKVREIIRKAQVLVAGRRLLDYFPDHPGQTILLGKDPETTLAQLPALATKLRVVVLASGDPNFYGVGPLVVKVLGAERVVIHPNVTAVQAACARLKLPWQDAVVVSLHGRPWTYLEVALNRAADKLIIYTDPEHTPAAIAGFLLERGHSEARLCVLEDLGLAAERLTWLSPAEAREREFSPLNMVVILIGEDRQTQTPAAENLRRLHLGFPEEAYAHQGGLITKTEVRAVALAKLQLYPGLTLWDLGAGCGSVGLEASLLLGNGRIIAVEQDRERAAQIRANADKFGVKILEVICGRAPGCLAGLPDPQRVFIGGGGQDLPGILEAAIDRLEPGGRLVLTATLLETLETARAMLATAGWQIEITQIQVSRSRPLAGGNYLQALNPVWIVTGKNQQV
ncbi:MAG: precorrin-6y C5,15-methyltransferase (decarboxylating) subunit CbiE [Deltaproteobacteria bacterium]|nr:precorrin-6y C5,15-methyltransferase (decarboxylating) subunit CbiE [Deltaproteobacteria bacterium]